jgi:hypothetical protein
VVGVTDELDETLKNHGVNKDKHVCMTVNALTDERADAVTSHFAKMGCTIGEKSQSGFVYCYRKAFNTKP